MADVRSCVVQSDIILCLARSGRLASLHGCTGGIGVVCGSLYGGAGCSSRLTCPLWAFLSIARSSVLVTSVLGRQGTPCVLQWVSARPQLLVGSVCSSMRAIGVLTAASSHVTTFTLY